MNSVALITRLQLFIVLFSSVYSNSAFANETFEIFILHSYSQEYPWTKSQHENFVKTITQELEQSIVFNTEYLDTKRRELDQDYRSQYISYLETKYKHYHPDLIYVTDDDALNFVLNNFKNLFKDIPIVFSGINDLHIQAKIDREQITGVFEKKDISGNLEILQSIDLGIKDIIVAGDNSNTYKAIEKEIKQQLKQHPSINASYIAHHEINNLISELKQREEKYLFLTTLGGMTDNHGQTLPLNETISQIRNTGNFIIISMEDAYLQKGVLGGLVTSGKYQGKYAANLAGTYLQKTPIDKIPAITESPNEYSFDYHELLRNKITLPDNILTKANILNKPLSFYQRNRVMILSSIVVLASIFVLSLFIFTFLLSRKNILIQLASSRKEELESLVKERTQELEIEKQKLNQAQAITHIGSYNWDVASNKTSWSDELYRIVGHSKSTFQPTYDSYVSCIYTDDKEKFLTLTGDALKQKGDYHAEYRILRADGEVRHIYEQGNVKYDQNNKLEGLVGVIQDITERVQYENKLKSQRDFTNTVLEVAGNIIAVIDLNGCFVRFNRAAEKLTGFSRNEVLNKTVWSTVIPEEQIEIVKNVFNNLRNGNIELANHYINDWKTKDGRRKTIDWRNSVLHDDNGNISHIVALGYDMSDILASNAAQNRLQRELNQSRKMEALGQLTGGIAHDFNNMLGIIIGYTDLALEHDAESMDTRIHTYFSNISQASKRAKDLVSQMMVFSRSDKSKSEPLDLDLIISESIDMLRSIIPSSIKIKYTHQDNLPMVLMDAVQMQQVLINLCLNSKDAMDGAGDLEIDLGWHLNINSECIACHKHIAGDWIQVTVSDTGTGMSADILERIFEPFFTTKEVGKGTGMGLSVVHSIIDNHGGHILIDTEIKPGTTLHLLLPAVSEQNKLLAKDNELHNIDKHIGTGEKILIIDDEIALANYVAEMLTTNGYECTTCTESDKAAMLFESNGPYDLVVTDQTMPEITGIEIIRQLRLIKADIPAILITGYSETISKESIEKENIIFMYKPISSKDFLKNVALCINPVKHQLNN